MTILFNTPKQIKSIRPKPVANNAVMNIGPDKLFKKKKVINCPRPGSPLVKKKSPTMAPITARPAATRSPVKIAGDAAGICNLRKMTQRELFCRRKRSCREGCTD